MASNYIYKVVLGGSMGSGKTSFLNGTPFHEDDCSYIGVSFKLMDCIVNEDDQFTLQIWDFNDRDRYRFLFPSFCLGAKAAILCFDVSDTSSFDDLTFWLDLVRTHDPDIPIFLIGTKIDLQNNISIEEIEDFVRSNKIKDVFFTSINYEDRKNAVFKKLLRSINSEIQIENFRTRQPANMIPLEDQDFQDFITLFASCPICKRDNHFTYLKKFYYSQDKKTLRLKESLMELIDESIDDLYHPKITIGIPCCDCFKNFFS